MVFLLTLSSGLHILHCLELSSKIQIFPVKNFKKGKFCGIKLFMIQPRLMAMINEAKKQSKAKRKKHFGKFPKMSMMSLTKRISTFHLYLKTRKHCCIIAIGRPLNLYCHRQFHQSMIAMPYVFPAGELLLANKFYLRSLIT